MFNWSEVRRWWLAVRSLKQLTPRHGNRRDVEEEVTPLLSPQAFFLLPECDKSAFSLTLHRHKIHHSVSNHPQARVQPGPSGTDKVKENAASTLQIINRVRPRGGQGGRGKKRGRTQLGPF